MKGVIKLTKTENFFKNNISPIAVMFMGALIGVQLFFLVLQHLFGKTSLIIAIVLPVAIITLYLTSNEHVDDKKKKMFLILLKIALSLAVINLFSHMFISFILKTSASLKGKKAILTLFQMLTVIVGISMMVLFRKDNVNESFDKLSEGSFWSLFKKKNKEDLKNGDVILCNDLETKEPIIWRYSDRFLHMLILGPTGSGKTSQILSPLINQDLQNRDAGLTVIEPKGDFAEQVQAMSEYYGREDETLYFNPAMKNCPSFNPLYGLEREVIENITTTFNAFSEGSSDFFKTQNETLVRNALRILKRMKGNDATMIDFYRLIHNSAGFGTKMLNDFQRKIGEGDEQTMKENEDLIAWFKDDYLSENSKTYEHCSGLRAQVSKLTSNPYLRRVLNPTNGGSDIDFDKHLEEGTVMAITTAQGELRDLSRFLGYFIILQFQSSVFKRPGNENTRKGHFLYIDEFQTYANNGFTDMLTQGRSYRVASHLATQNRSLIGANSGKDAKNFIEMVSTNARNVVIFPGGNPEDAKYYAEHFGAFKVKKTQVGVTRQKFNPLKGIKPMNYDSESIRETEEEEYLFTATEIKNRPFGEVIVALVDNNSVQKARAGKIEFIPLDVYEYVKKRTAEFHKEIEEFKKESSADETFGTASDNKKSKKTIEEKDVVMKDKVVKGNEYDPLLENKNSSVIHDDFDDMQMYGSSSGFEDDVLDQAMNHEVLSNHDFNSFDDDLI